MGIDTVESEKIQTSSQKTADQPSVVHWDSLPSSGQKLSFKIDAQCETLTAFKSAKQNDFRWSRVLRPPGELRLHSTLVRLKLIDSAIELNHAIRLQGRSVREPILITANGTIISGFREWHEAMSDGRPLVDCIEYSFSDEEAIEFILIHHRPRRAWNKFMRVRLALELEPYFERRALVNQFAGGKYKGSANLPKAERIEVREEVAGVAGVSGRTVTNVKTILKKAAPALIDALQYGTLTINRALPWCSLAKWEQLEHFMAHAVERAASKAICHAVNHSPIQNAGGDPLKRPDIYERSDGSTCSADEVGLRNRLAAMAWPR